MNETVNIADATAHLSALITRVEAGEEIILTRHGKPVARLTQLRPHRPDRSPGAWRGRVRIAADFDRFTPADAREWYGE
ncbi:type II toxin-antitoxin system Phd/YefM family antitoxin [Nakamurella silvestris]|nr:type II toxin-antitoxin system Phd/YefM family antitoxin [Nakamurella silvestris]